MPYTVWSAFDKFRKESVDLDSNATSLARSSRDFLFSQLKNLNNLDANCPKITNCMAYGSFARRTKIRPLNDIDLLATMVSTGTRPTQSSASIYTYWLKIDDSNSPLYPFRDDYGYVNSVKLLNQVGRSLSKVPQYSKAVLNRNQQAIVLNLTSYSWSYDIVPAIAVYNYYGTSIDYFLIPDGSRNWMRTDPRKDTEYVNKVSSQHNGNLLPVIRLLKYWNARTHKPVLPSYYFETLCLKFFDGSAVMVDYQSSLQRFFAAASVYLDISCSDPKGLGPNLDTYVSYETKQKVKTALSAAFSNAHSANAYEAVGNYKEAINSWKKVFGSSFPDYG